MGRGESDVCVCGGGGGGDKSNNDITLSSLSLRD